MTLQFRPMTSNDIPMLARWLETPEVARWFTDADYIDEMRGYLDDPRVTPRIVLEYGRPVAYVHDYDIAGWDDHPLAHLPAGSRGVDTFIGDAADMHRGLGPRYLTALARALFAAGVPALGIDPDPGHRAAIRAYEKAGFAQRGKIVTRWGPAVVMEMFPPKLPD